MRGLQEQKWRFHAIRLLFPSQNFQNRKRKLKTRARSAGRDEVAIPDDAFLHVLIIWNK